MNISRALALLVVLALSACKTQIVTADPHVGVEGEGEHQVRLYMDRVRISAEKSAGQGTACEECRVGYIPVRFTLPFVATNESETPWLLRAGMISLRRRDAEAHPDVDIHAFTSRSEEVLINVAPGSYARFSILVHASGPTADDAFDGLDGEYDLYVRDESDETMLHRRLHIGSFSQAWQGVRLGVSTTILLLLVGL